MNRTELDSQIRGAQIKLHVAYERMNKERDPNQAELYAIAYIEAFSRLTELERQRRDQYGRRT
jgi:hypothetical protein